MAEIVDLYDVNRIKTNETMIRGSKCPAERYHLLVHVCIFNSNGQMLIQQRQNCKMEWPNLWDITVGGSATMGENSFQAAEREVFEELGYKIDMSNQRPHFTINFKYGFDDFYMIEKNVDLKSLSLQVEEVRDVMWATKETVLKMIDDETFIPYYKSFIESLFEMKARRGLHTKGGSLN